MPSPPCGDVDPRHAGLFDPESTVDVSVEILRFHQLRRAVPNGGDFSAMGGKVKDFQKHIQDDADFKETINGDYVFVEFHLSWAGPCECVRPMLYRNSLDKEGITFCTAPADKLPIYGKDYKDKVKPTFIMYRKGKVMNIKGAPMEPIDGVNTPRIQSILDNISFD